MCLSFTFRYFCKILDAFSSPGIYKKYIKLPCSDDPPLALIADDPIMHPFFKDAVGAMDGMHIPCVPGVPTKRAFRSRRGIYSQYCLVCCNFNLEFTYVVSGWEGCANDEQVYCDVRTKDLPIPPGKYYLADIAFPACSQLLVPYSTQRHLLEWERKEMRYIGISVFWVNSRLTCLRKDPARMCTTTSTYVMPSYEASSSAPSTFSNNGFEFSPLLPSMS